MQEHLNLFNFQINPLCKMLYEWIPGKDQALAWEKYYLNMYTINTDLHKPLKDSNGEELSCKIPLNIKLGCCARIVIYFEEGYETSKKKGISVLKYRTTGYWILKDHGELLLSEEELKYLTDEYNSIK